MPFEGDNRKMADLDDDIVLIHLDAPPCRDCGLHPQQLPHSRCAACVEARRTARSVKGALA